MGGRGALGPLLLFPLFQLSPKLLFMRLLPPQLL